MQAPCVGENTASTADGVAVDSVNIATLAIDFAALAKIGFGVTDRDPTGTFETFMNAANDAGGVCGRTVKVQKIVYDVLQGQAGQACVEATEDRVNLLVNTASFDQPLCLTDAGLPTQAGTDLTAAQLAQGKGLIFSRAPLLEQQYKATVQHAVDEGALTGKVGVWYGTIFPSQGDAIEAEVLPMLDAAGVDYVAYRTDSAGPSDPEGNAILTSAATDFVAQGVDTVLMFVGPTNLTGMQNELHAQGLDPKYVSAPVNGNTSNEIFANGFGTRAFTNGQEYVTFSLGASELDSSNPIAASCHKQWHDLTGETIQEKTFDYLLIVSECIQVDEVLAALSIAGGDLTRASIVTAFESVPAHKDPALLGELGWTPQSHGGSSTFSFQVYDSATNSVATDPKYFDVAP